MCMHVCGGDGREGKGKEGGILCMYEIFVTAKHVEIRINK